MCLSMLSVNTLIWTRPMPKGRYTQFEQLMADPRLAELNELQRGASDALELIKLYENQNSDILAWLFDSREGHGQGDGIFKDLLLDASKRAMEHSYLDPNSTTRKFFDRLTPSKIQTMSFGSAFPVREFGFVRENRTDLAVIDEQNELIVVIENKTESKHGAGQLNRYRADFEKAVGKNKRLSSYSVAFLAMSEAFDYDEEVEQPCSRTWLHVGYGWLKPSADRAVRQVQRGNVSASLVANYCTLRTQWEDPLDVERNRRAASLLRDYPQAIARLRELYDDKVTARWFEHDEASPAMLFILQNRATAKLLAEMKGPQALATRVEELLGLQPNEAVEWGKRYVNVRAPAVERLSVDHYWVSYFNLQQFSTGEEKQDEQRYDVCLFLRPDKFSSADDEHRIRATYKAVDQVFARTSSRRLCRAVLGRALTEDDALALLSSRYRALNAA